MKKITLFLFSFCISAIGLAQDSCATAVSVSAGITSVGAIDGTVDDTCYSSASNGEWYSYTPSGDGYIIITSDLPQNDGTTNSDDTRLSIFTDGCGALSCFTGNDDIDFDSGNYLSEVAFYVESGVEYLIHWDDRWSSLGFDFELTEDLASCTGINSFPFTDDFATPNFSCWDNIDDDGDGQNWFSVNYTVDSPGDFCVASASWNGSALTPDNWLISQAIDLTSYTTGDMISLTWVARGLDEDFPAENYTVYAATGNMIADFTSSGVDFNETLVDGGEGDGTYTPTRSLNISSLAGNMVYVAFRHHGVSDQFILTIDNIGLTATLNTNDFEANQFTHIYNRDTNILKLESTNLNLDTVEIYNLLGQSVINKPLSNLKDEINLTSLNDGLYIAKVKIGDGEETIKFYKQ